MSSNRTPSVVDSDVAIEIRGLGKSYQLTPRRWSGHFNAPENPAGDGSTFWALRDVNVQVKTGETLGILGRNGAGKSTLLKILASITDPSEGKAVVRGRVGTLLEVGAGFHGELTGRDNIMLVGSILGMRRRETLEAFDKILDFSGVASFLDVPVKRYSSGMYLRLAFSVAAHLETEIMLIDEALAVGDQAFREKCLVKLRSLASDGRTVVLVSHDPGSIVRMCERAIVLEKGRLIGDGPASDALRIYGSMVAHSVVAFEATELVGDRPQVVACRRDVASIDALPSGAYPIGQPLELLIDVDIPADQSVAGLNVLVEVMGGDLWAVTGSIHSLRDALPGRHRMRCTIPNLRVAPGRFSIAVTLKRRNEVLEVIRQLCPFEVDGIGSSGPTWTWRYVEDATWTYESASLAIPTGAP